MEKLPLFASIASFTIALLLILYYITKKSRRKNVIYIIALLFISGTYSALRYYINSHALTLTSNIYIKFAFSLLVFFVIVLIFYSSKLYKIKINKLKIITLTLSGFMFVFLFTPFFLGKKELIIKSRIFEVSYPVFARKPLFYISSFFLFIIIITMILKFILKKGEHKKYVKESFFPWILLLFAGIHDAAMFTFKIHSFMIVEYSLIIISLFFIKFLIEEINENEEAIIMFNENLIKEKAGLEENIAKKTKELIKTKNELEKIDIIARQISATLNFDEVFEKIVTYLFNKYGFEGCGLYMVSEDKKSYTFQKAYPVTSFNNELLKNLDGIKLPINENFGWVPEAIAKNKYVYVPNIIPMEIKHPTNRAVVELLHIKSILILPIHTGKDIVGAFSLTSHSERIFLEESDIKSINYFVSQIAIVVKNSKIYNELENKNIEIKNALEKAEEANKLKTEFVAILSHEIRTPLTGIKGFSQYLLETKIPYKEQKEYLERINDLTNKLNKILSDLLELSVLEAGKHEKHVETFKIKNVIDDIYIIFKHVIDNKGLKFSLVLNRIDTIDSDPKIIRQILLNLIGNSIKFTDKGGITVELASKKNEYLFSVKDTGIGIDKKNQQIVFGMFTQVEESLTRKHSGTGVGLGICKRLVDALNGKIWVESEPGKGCTFFFTIPKFQQNKNEN